MGGANRGPGGVAIRGILVGVATVPEGIELRTAGIQAPIMVMGAINSTEEMQAVAHWRAAAHPGHAQAGAHVFRCAVATGDDRIPPPCRPTSSSTPACRD